MASEIEDEQKFYGDAKQYWESIPATIDGMLGGFAQISPTDINGSRAFLRPYLKTGGGDIDCNFALDCGAGIGRITKRLLLPIFKTVDMVELNQKFLDRAPEFIGQDASRVERFICSGLQDFVPEAGRYDIIWCQWVLGHLTEPHLMSFFKNCRQGLKSNGLLIVKENVTGTEEKDFDDDDSSYTRSKDELTKIMIKAGLKIIKEAKQKGFPKGLYDVYMFALR